MIQFFKKLFLKIKNPTKVFSSKSTDIDNDFYPPTQKTDDKDYSLISEYVKLFITLSDFKSSQFPSVIDSFHEYEALPSKISMISFEYLKEQKVYVINLECSLKGKYNTKILFHVEYVTFDNANLVSLIRDRKLSQLV